MHCCLWFRLIFRVRGPWPKRYGYHLSIIFYVTVDHKCYKISYESCAEVLAIQCNQEEADGCLLLLAAHATRKGYEAVIISSEDTNVFILALSLHNKITARLFQRCGTKYWKRLVNLKNAVTTLSIDVCMGLIGMHTYTGCNTVSAFAGNRKPKALKLLINDQVNQSIFLQLDQEWVLSSELIDQVEAFTCQIYALKAPTSMVNKLKYYLFCAKRGEIESQ